MFVRDVQTPIIVPCLDTSGYLVQVVSTPEKSSSVNRYLKFVRDVQTPIIVSCLDTSGNLVLEVSRGIQRSPEMTRHLSTCLDTPCHQVLKVSTLDRDV